MTVTSPKKNLKNHSVFKLNDANMRMNDEHGNP